MLITNNVVLRWSPRNKTYFINKGYKFSEYNKEFLVKVSDLTRKNDSVIEYMCDICFRYYSTTYDNALNNFDKNGFHKCKKCASQETGSKRRMDEGSIQNEFEKHNLTLLDSLSTYKNDRTKLKFRCNTHDSIIQEVSYNKLRTYKFPCRLCNNENISSRQRGSDNATWKGGISSIHGYLRRELKTAGWYYKSSNIYKSKCAITGKRADQIHHLYSFNKILDEAVKEFNLSIKAKISDYTEEELSIFKERFFTVHNRYPLGVPLAKEVHKQYHAIYGDDNTEEQFEEFKKQYDFGV